MIQNGKSYKQMRNEYFVDVHDIKIYIMGSFISHLSRPQIGWG